MGDVGVARLADVTTRIGSGITPRGGSNVYKKTGRPFVRSQNVGWGELKLADLVYLDEKTHSTFTASEVRTGDVLLNITGASIGRSAVASSELAGGNVNQHVCEIRLRPSMDPTFVCAVLNSDLGQRQISAFQAGGNREGLNFKQVGAIEIPCLPVQDQVAVGHALMSVVGQAEALARLIEKKHDVKQGIMQGLLSATTGQVSTLGNLGTFIRGVSYEPKTDLLPFRSKDSVDLYRANNVQNGKIVETEVQFVRRERVRPDQRLRPGDILICAANGSKNLVGKSAPIADSSVDSTFGAFMMTFRPNGGLMHTGFAGYCFQTKAYRDWVETLLAGSSINNLRPSNVGALEVVLPSLGKQSEIAEVLRNADAEIEALERRLESARAVKVGMMQ